MNQQLAIDFSRAARDAGMQAAMDHAESVSPGWSERAYQMLCQYASIGKQFTSYDFRQSLRGYLESPTTDKAFGPVFLKAAKAGIIRKVGYTQHPERNCSPTPVWEAV